MRKLGNCPHSLVPNGIKYIIILYNDGENDQCFHSFGCRM